MDFAVGGGKPPQGDLHHLPGKAVGSRSPPGVVPGKTLTTKAATCRLKRLQVRDFSRAEHAREAMGLLPTVHQTRSPGGETGFVSGGMVTAGTRGASSVWVPAVARRQ